MQLPSPFGIKWLTLKDLGLNIDYDKNKTGKFEFATTLKPFGKIQPNISVDLKEEGGKLKAGVLKIKDNIFFRYSYHEQTSTCRKFCIYFS